MMRVLPFLIFTLLSGVLLLSLYHTHQLVEEQTGLVSTPWPQAPVRDGSGKAIHLDAEYFHHRVTVVNMFASWCLPCQSEMPDLVKFKSLTHAQFVGIVWNDTPNAMLPWLKKYGNPFDTIYYDNTGQAAIALGLRGVPESYIVDKNGVMRYHRIGVISPELVQQELLPIMQQLEKE